MTSPEGRSSARYALFASGAAFSGAVLEGLLARDCPPALIVLPEYPPAPRPGDLLQAGPTNDFLDLAGGFELAYAPRERQIACAELLRQRRIDYLLVACWPYLIGAEIRRCPEQAALNLHPSLLPRYRGADPVAAQLRAGERRFGVTLHLLDDRFDHGDIVAQAEFELDAKNPDRDQVEQCCAERGVELFLEAQNAGSSAWRCRRQDRAGQA